MAKNIPGYIKKHLVLDDLTSSLPLLRFIDSRGTVTQAEAADAIGLARGTCNLHFQKLEHMGLIRRSETLQPKGRGRSTILWKPVQDKNLVLVMLFVPPFFEGALLDFSGATLFNQKLDLSNIQTGKKLLTEVSHFINAALVQAQRVRGTVRQSFIGTSGLIDPDSGTIISVANMPALTGICFPQWIQTHYDLPCVCETIGLPLYHGETQNIPENIRTMVVLWDLGIGAIAGKGPQLIVKESKLMLPDIGHIRIQRNGRACHCGKKGCLEAYTGGWAMIEMLNDPKIKTLGSFCSAVLSGHKKAVQTAENAVRILGKHLCWSLQVTRTEHLIVGGPLSSIFPVVRDAFIEGLSTVFDRKEIAALNPEASISPEHAMRTGAYLCARNLFFHPESWESTWTVMRKDSPGVSG
ncbi:MAG: ROK family transcriptional regulator [Kiritimatiellales bacterium]